MSYDLAFCYCVTISTLAIPMNALFTAWANSCQILILGQLYNAAEFLSVHEYKNVARWANEIAARPAVQRGRRVNRY